MPKKGYKQTEEHKKNISKQMEGNNHSLGKHWKLKCFRKLPPKSNEHKIKIGKGVTKYLQNPKILQKLNEELERNRFSRVKGSKYPHTETTKQKIRKGAINYLNDVRYIKWPCLGKYEKRILDNLEKCFNYPIERQKQVGGFYLDGYCPALNLTIEIDEPFHQKYINEDIRREQFIKQEINCQFLRITLGGIRNMLLLK